MTFSTIMGAIELGLIFSILSLGLYITFRILNLPDLTVDGSFVSGVAVCSLFTLNNQPLSGLIGGMMFGMLAGMFTGILHTKLKIHAILAGILTMTALYSVNLRIMNDKPSIYLGNNENVFTGFLNKIFINNYDFGYVVALSIIVLLIILSMFIFLKTQIGMSLRATGDNEAMVRSSSINTDLMKILGFALCNGIVALSGGIYALYTSTATVSIGQGMLVLGLANIIIGETFLRKRSILLTLIFIVLGAIIYRLVLTSVFRLGLPASDIRLFSAIIVIAAISFPTVKAMFNNWRKRNAGT